MYSAKIICDSISETGKRLTTFEITFPRIALAEFNTHRMLSRNSASSRAIPFKKQIERIIDFPFIPEIFPVNGKGMQPDSYVDKNDERYNKCLNNWLEARDAALDSATRLYCGLDEHFDYADWDWQYSDGPIPAVHKQLVNRLLEPFMWHTVIVTATEWDNFFKLRTNPQAQYEIKRIADLMYDLYHTNFNYNNVPNHPAFGKIKQLKVGEWHLPFIYHDEDYVAINNYINNYVSTLRGEGFHIPTEQILRIGTKVFTEMLKRISVARCARVSYLTHDGKRDIEKDLELFERLRTSGHWSPFEHVATPYFEYGEPEIHHQNNFPESGRYAGYIWNKNNNFTDFISGNFIGWKQFRKEFADENCTHFRKEN